MMPSTRSRNFEEFTRSATISEAFCTSMGPNCASLKSAHSTRTKRKARRPTESDSQLRL